MRVGRYEVETEIARGGMGVVYKARGPSGDAVAIKVVRDQDGRNILARFERERRLLAELVEDDGFVPLEDAGVTDEGPYLVMPFLPGGTLRDRLGRKWTAAATVALGRTLARALGRAHARGIVHRDLKPENILFTKDDTPLIADLGLAKHFSRDGAQSTVALTQMGHMIGTAGYMAPEQISAAKLAGPPADVFALGLILHECLTGRPAFSGKNPAELLANIAECRVASLREKRRDVPPALVQIIETALAASPELRFKDGDAFAHALALDFEEPPSSRFATVLALLAAVAVIALLALAGESEPGSGRDPGAAAVSSEAASTSR